MTFTNNDGYGITDSILNSIKLNFLMNNNNMFATIFITIIISFLSSLLQNNSKKNLFTDLSKETIYSLLYKQNKIIIEGKRCFKSSEYITRNEILFGHNFRALFHFIHSNLNNFNINSIKEYTNESSVYDDNYHQKNENNNDKIIDDTIYIINQKKSFIISNQIYCKIIIDKENIDSTNSKTQIQIENIKIILFSYIHPISHIQSFINQITEKYILSINNFRSNKLFIYSYKGVKDLDDDNYSRNRNKNPYSRWSECPFSSNRTFDNMFFDEKEKLIQKIDFFQSNPDWFAKAGSPHTLGIGLSGPPGTGKTSVIKSIANKLNRHLIIIPLQKIKTTNDLTNCFFEEKYNHNNKENSITFDKKIIVFEDIDCMSDIVNQRNSNITTNNSNNSNNNGNNKQSNDLNTSDIISAVVKGMQDDDISILKNIKTNNDDQICLSDILNLIDGIRETPGRILIITSNFYNNLDKALIRPGRIDITLNMKNASKQTICQMFQYLYDKPFPTSKIDLCKDHFISPAQLFNIHLNSTNSTDFIHNLLLLMN